MGEATWCIQGALGSIGSERGGGRRAAEVDGEGPQLSQDALWTFSGVGCGALEGLS